MYIHSRTSILYLGNFHELRIYHFSTLMLIRARLGLHTKFLKDILQDILKDILQCVVNKQLPVETFIATTNQKHK